MKMANVSAAIQTGCNVDQNSEISSTLLSQITTMHFSSKQLNNFSADHDTQHQISQAKCRGANKQNNV